MPPRHFTFVSTPESPISTLVLLTPSYENVSVGGIVAHPGDDYVVLHTVDVLSAEVFNDLGTSFGNCLINANRGVPCLSKEENPNIVAGVATVEPSTHVIFKEIDGPRPSPVTTCVDGVSASINMHYCRSEFSDEGSVGIVLRSQSPEDPCTDGFYCTSDLVNGHGESKRYVYDRCVREDMLSDKDYGCGECYGLGCRTSEDCNENARGECVFSGDPLCKNRAEEFDQTHITCSEATHLCTCEV